MSDHPIPKSDRDGDTALVYWLTEECDHWAVAELKKEGEHRVSWRLFEVEGVEIGPEVPELREQARQLLTVADCWGQGWFKWDGCAAVDL